MALKPNLQIFALFAAALVAGGHAEAAQDSITDKTLVAWVSPANLEQRGGGVLTLEKEGGVFDAIVLGEIEPARWMAGSEFFHRTAPDQARWPAETQSGGSLVQIAIAYAGTQVTIYRDARAIASYDAGSAASFDDASTVVMGLRHLAADAGSGHFFTGSIDDARIYASALDGPALATLRPNQASPEAPIAWWDFEQGSAADRMRRFASSTLTGGARLDAGHLVLDQPSAYLLATRWSPAAAVTRAGSPAEAARALREHLLADPHRPGYHFAVPEGICMPFDPNGAIFWRGRYHLFYIYQDQRGHNWGHVSSTDLFHWRHHPTGLVDGMFSGNCFIDRDGCPTMCYHQVGQGNALAVALDDELNEWQKLDSNPITPATAAGDPHHGIYQSWDPFGWFEDGSYYSIFGGQRPAVAKAAELRGPWSYVGDLMAGAVDGVAIDEDVSCADFFQLGDERMLLCISHRLGCRYYLGEWKNEQFHPRLHEMMSWSDNSFFAPESLLDDRGRRIMWAWIFDEPDFRTRTGFDWSGVMSLPRVLALGEDRTLRIDLPEEIERLRYGHARAEGLTVAAPDRIRLGMIEGSSIELLLEVDLGTATEFGVEVCASPGGEETTRVSYDAGEKRLKIDATRSSSSRQGPCNVEAGPFELGAGEPLRLRIFVDKSVVEAFANSRQAVMRRVYPVRNDSVQVAVFAVGGVATIRSLDAWQMSPSNPF